MSRMTIMFVPLYREDEVVLASHVSPFSRRVPSTGNRSLPAPPCLWANSTLQRAQFQFATSGVANAGTVPTVKLFSLPQEFPCNSECPETPFFSTLFLLVLSRPPARTKPANFRSRPRAENLFLRLPSPIAWSVTGALKICEKRNSSLSHYAHAHEV